MRHVFNILSFAFALTILVIPCELFSQKQTFDLATYTPPKAWKKQTTKDAVQFAKEDTATGGYCIISLLKAVPGTADSKGNFDAAWEAIVKEMVTVSADPEMQPASSENGWELQTGHAAFENEDNKGVVILVTATASGKMINLVILTNSNIYEKNISDFMASISLKKQEAVPQQTPANSNNASVTGLWGVSSTTASYYNVSINEGSIVKQYKFNADGTYSFTIKTFQYLLTNLLLTRETGTYKISGNTITISPLKSATEAWTKKNGDDWGKLVSTQKRPLEKTTYNFSVEDYGLGLVLVMKAGSVTKRDGPFNNSNKDSWTYPAKSEIERIKLPEGNK
ncbi:MAG: lipocalin family protein [Chitinophagaceae bacterium]